MLENAPVHPILLSTNLERPVISTWQARTPDPGRRRAQDRIPVRCWNQLAVSKSTLGTSDSQTQIGWEVDDLSAEPDALRSRG